MGEVCSGHAHDALVLVAMPEEIGAVRLPKLTLQPQRAATPWRGGLRGAAARICAHRRAWLLCGLVKRSCCDALSPETLRHVSLGPAAPSLHIQASK